MTQIYVKSDKNDDFTSVLVASDKGDIYYSEILEAPEITGIHQGVSYVKNMLDRNEPTDIFAEKTNPETIFKDAYIRYTRVPVMIGNELRFVSKLNDVCKMKLQQHFRWNMFEKGNTR